MSDLSQGAEHVLASYRANHGPGGERQADAEARLRRALVTDRSSSGPIVNARFRRVRQAKLMFRAVRRATVTGVLVFGVIWFLDKGMDELSSESMLEDAQEHLERGRYRDAYKVLALHAKRHPTRANAELRMGMVVDALCGMKMPIRARAELGRYLDRIPESEHKGRIFDPCRGIQPVVDRAAGSDPSSEFSDPGRRTPDWMPADEQFGPSVHKPAGPRTMPGRK